MIRQRVRRGGRVVLGALFALALLGALGLSQIRVGGPLHRQQKLTGEYLADIMPPPQYVIEPMLEVARLVQDPASLEQRRSRLSELEQAYHERSAYWANSDLDRDLKTRHLNEAASKADEFWRVVDSELLPAIEHGDAEAGERAYRKVDTFFASHRAAIQALSDESVRHGAAFEESALSTVNAVIALLGLVALGAMALVYFGLRRLLCSALDPMLAAAETMHAMAAGDLEAGRCHEHRDDEVGDMTRAIEVFRDAARRQGVAEMEARLVVSRVSNGLDALARGELGYRLHERFSAEFESLRTAFNLSLEKLGKVIADVSGSANRVSAAAEEIGAASSDLAKRNVMQASHVEENLEALRHILSLLQGNEAVADVISASVSRAHAEAVHGGAVVTGAVDAVNALEKSSDEIEQIVSLIDGIAFQTNLLALNAGVEAARAGEAGRGFAVVASEVRALAQRASVAASDIRTLISGSGKQVKASVLLVAQTGEALEQIVSGMGQVSRQVEAVVASIADQARSLGNVRQTSQAIVKVTQHNAAMAEQSDAAAKALIREAQGLDALVQRFRLNDAPANELRPARRAA